MSSTEETPDLKAGHLPAVKVGGMRITQNKPIHDKPQPKVDSKDDEEEEEVVEEPPPKTLMSISGAPARGDQDFPASSIKAYHEKTPLPTNDFRPVFKNHSIHQPKK